MNCGFFFVFPHHSIFKDGHTAIECTAEEVCWEGGALSAYRRWREHETGGMAETVLKSLSGGRLLEVGFGEFPINRSASCAGFDWWGLEPDQVLLRAALERYTLEQARIFQMGVEQLDAAPPFATMNGFFDAIVFFNALNVVADPAAVLNSFRRLLSSNGKLAISVADASGFGLITRLRKLAGMEPWTYSIISFFNEKNLRMLFEMSGFRVVEFKIMPILTPLSIEYLYRQNNSLLIKLGLNSIHKAGLDRMLGLNTFLIILEKS